MTLSGPPRRRAPQLLKAAAVLAAAAALPQTAAPQFLEKTQPYIIEGKAFALSGYDATLPEAKALCAATTFEGTAGRVAAPFSIDQRDAVSALLHYTSTDSAWLGAKHEAPDTWRWGGGTNPAFFKDGACHETFECGADVARLTAGSAASHKHLYQLRDGAWRTTDSDGARRLVVCEFPLMKSRRGSFIFTVPTTNTQTSDAARSACSALKEKAIGGAEVIGGLAAPFRESLGIHLTRHMAAVGMDSVWLALALSDDRTYWEFPLASGFKHNPLVAYSSLNQCYANYGMWCGNSTATFSAADIGKTLFLSGQALDFGAAAASDVHNVMCAHRMTDFVADTSRTIFIPNDIPAKMQWNETAAECEAISLAGRKAWVATPITDRDRSDWSVLQLSMGEGRAHTGVNDYAQKQGGFFSLSNGRRFSNGLVIPRASVCKLVPAGSRNLTRAVCLVPGCFWDQYEPNHCYPTRENIVHTLFRGSALTFNDQRNDASSSPIANVFCAVDRASVDLSVKEVKLLDDGPVPYAEAQSKCRAQGMRLATSVTDSELRSLTLYTADRPALTQNPDDTRFWLGATKSAGAWKWDETDPVSATFHDGTGCVSFCKFNSAAEGVDGDRLLLSPAGFFHPVAPSAKAFPLCESLKYKSLSDMATGLPFGPTKPDVDSWKDEEGKDATGTPLTDASCQWTKVTTNKWSVAGVPRCSKIQLYEFDDDVAAEIPSGAVNAIASVKAMGTAPGQSVELVVQPVDKNGNPVGPPSTVSKDLPHNGDTVKIDAPTVSLPPNAAYLTTAIRTKNPDDTKRVEVENPVVWITKDVSSATPISVGDNDADVSKWRPGKDSGSACNWASSGTKEWTVSGAPTCTRINDHSFPIHEQDLIRRGRAKMEVSMTTEASAAGQQATLTLQQLNADGVPTAAPLTRTVQIPPSGGPASVVIDEATLNKDTEYVRAVMAVKGGDKGHGVKVVEPVITLREDLDGALELPFGSTDVEQPPATWTPESGSDAAGNPRADPSCTWNDQGSVVRTTGGPSCSHQRNLGLTADVKDRVPLDKVSVKGEIAVKGTKPGQKVELILEPMDKDGKKLPVPPIKVEGEAPISGPTTLQTPKITLPAGADYMRATVRVSGAGTEGVETDGPRIIVSEDLAAGAGSLPLGPTTTDVAQWPTEPGKNPAGKDNNAVSCTWEKQGDAWKVGGGESCSRERVFELEPEVVERTGSGAGKAVLVADYHSIGTVAGQTTEVEIQPLRADGSLAGAPFTMRSKELPRNAAARHTTPKIPLPEGTTHVRTVVRALGTISGGNPTPLTLTDPLLTVSLDNSADNLPFGTTTPSTPDAWAPEPGNVTGGGPIADPACVWQQKGTGAHVAGAKRCAKETVHRLDPAVADRLENGKVSLETSVTAKGSGPGQKVELVSQPLDEFGRPVGSPAIKTVDLPANGSPVEIKTEKQKLPEGATEVRTTLRTIGADAGNGIDVSNPAIKVTEEVDPAPTLPLGVTDPDVPGWKPQPGSKDSQPYDSPTCSWSPVGAQQWDVVGDSCSREETYALSVLERLKVNQDKIEVKVDVSATGAGSPAQAVEMIVTPLNADGVPLTPPQEVHTDLSAAEKTSTTGYVRLPSGTTHVRTVIRTKSGDKEKIRVSRPKIHLRELLNDAAPVTLGPNEPPFDKWKPEPGSATGSVCQWSELGDKFAVEGAPLCSRQRDLRLEPDVVNRLSAGNVNVVAEVNATGVAPGQKVELVVLPLRADGTPAGPPRTAEAAAPTNGAQMVKTPMLTLPADTTHLRTTVRVKGSDNGPVEVTQPKVTISEPAPPSGPQLPFGPTDPEVDTWPNQPGNKPDGKPASDASCNFAREGSKATWTVTGGPTCSKEQVYGLQDAPASKVNDGKVAVTVEVNATGLGDKPQAAEVMLQPLDKNGKPLGPPLRTKAPLSKNQKEPVRVGPVTLPPGTDRLRTVLRTEGAEDGAGVKLSDPKITVAENPSAKKTLPMGTTTPNVDKWEKEQGKDDASCEWVRQAGDSWRVVGGASCSRQRTFKLNDEAKDRAMVAGVDAWAGVHALGSTSDQAVELVLQPLDSAGAPVGPPTTVKAKTQPGKEIETTPLTLPVGSTHLQVTTRVTGANAHSAGVMLTDPAIHLNQHMAPTKPLGYGTKTPAVPEWPVDPTSGGDGSPNSDVACKWTPVTDVENTWDVTGAPKCGRERLYALEPDVVARASTGGATVRVETEVKGSSPGQLFELIVEPLSDNGTLTAAPTVVSVPATNNGRVVTPDLTLPGGTKNLRVKMLPIGCDKGEGIRVTEPKIHVMDDMTTARPIPFGKNPTDVSTWKPTPGVDKCQWQEGADTRWRATGTPCSRERSYKVPVSNVDGQVVVSVTIDPEGTAPDQEVAVLVQPFDAQGRPLGEPVETKLPAKQATGDDGNLTTPDVPLPANATYVRVTLKPDGADRGKGVLLTEPTINVSNDADKLPIGVTHPDVGKWPKETGATGNGDAFEDDSCKWTPQAGRDGWTWLVTGGPSCSRSRNFDIDSPEGRRLLLNASTRFYVSESGQRVQLLVTPLDAHGKALRTVVKSASGTLSEFETIMTDKIALAQEARGVRVTMRVTGGEKGTGVLIADPTILLQEDSSSAGTLPVGETDPDISTGPEWGPAAGSSPDGTPRNSENCTWTPSGATLHIVTGGASCAREGLYEIEDGAKGRGAEVDVSADVQGSKPGQRAAITVQLLDVNGSPVGPNITQWVVAPASAPAGSVKATITLPPGATHVRAIVEVKGSDKGAVQVSKPLITLSMDQENDPVLPPGVTKSPVGPWKDEPGSGNDGTPRSSPECVWAPDKTEGLDWRVTAAPKCSKEQTFKLEQRIVDRASSGKFKLGVQVDAEGTGPGQEVEVLAQQLDAQGKPLGSATVAKLTLAPGDRTRIATAELPVVAGAAGVRTTVRVIGADAGAGVLLATPAISVVEDIDQSTDLGYEKKKPDLATWQTPPGSEPGTGAPSSDSSCQWKPVAGASDTWDVVGGPACSKEHTFKLKPEVLARMTAANDSKIVVQVDAESTEPGQVVELEIMPMAPDGTPLTGALPIQITQELNPSGPTKIATAASLLPPNTAFVQTTVRVKKQGDADKPVRLSTPVVEVFTGSRSVPPPPSPTPTSPAKDTPITDPKDLPLGTTGGKLEEWGSPDESVNPTPGAPFDSSSCKWTKDGDRHAATGASSCARGRDFELSAAEQAKASAGTLNFTMDLKAEGTSSNAGQAVEVVAWPVGADRRTIGDPITQRVSLPADGSTVTAAIPSAKLPPGTKWVKAVVVATGGNEGQGVRVADPRLHLIEISTLPSSPTRAPVGSWPETPAAQTTPGAPQTESGCQWTEEAASPPTWTVTGGKTCSRSSTSVLSPEDIAKVQRGEAALSFTVNGSSAKPAEVELVAQSLDGEGNPIGKPFIVKRPLDANGSPTPVTLKNDADPKLPPGTKSVAVTMRATTDDPTSPITLTDPKLHLTFPSVIDKDRKETDPSTGTPAAGSDPMCKFEKLGDGRVKVTGGATCARSTTHSLEPADATKARDGKLSLAGQLWGWGTDPAQKASVTVQPLDASGKPLGSPIKITGPLPHKPTELRTSNLKLPPGTQQVRTTTSVSGASSGTGVILDGPYLLRTESTDAAEPLPVGTKDVPVGNWTSKPGADDQGIDYDDPSCRYTQNADGPNTTRVTGGPSCTKTNDYKLTPVDAPKTQDGRLSVVVDVPAEGTADGQKVEITVQPMFPNGTKAGPLVTVSQPLKIGEKVAAQTVPVKLPPGADGVRTTVRVTGGDKGQGVSLKSPTVTLLENPELPSGTTPGEVDKWTPEAGTDPSGTPRNDPACRFTPRADGAVVVDGADKCSRQQTHAFPQPEKDAANDGKLRLRVEAPVAGSAPGQKAELEVQPLDAAGSPLGAPIRVPATTVNSGAGPTVLQTPEVALPGGTAGVRTAVRVSGADKGTGIALDTPLFHVRTQPRSTPLPVGTTKGTLDKDSPAPGTDREGKQMDSPACLFKPENGLIRVTGAPACARQHVYSILPADKPKLKDGRLNVDVLVKGIGSDGGQAVEVYVVPLFANGSAAGPQVFASSILPPGDNVTTVSAPINLAPGTEFIRTTVRALGPDAGTGVLLSQPEVRLTDTSAVGLGENKPPASVMAPSDDPVAHNPACKVTTTGADKLIVRGAPKCTVERNFTLDPRAAEAAKKGDLAGEVAVTAEGTANGQEVELVVQPRDRDGNPLGRPITVVAAVPPGDGPQRIAAPLDKLPADTATLDVSLSPTNSDKGTGVSLKEPVITLTEKLPVGDVIKTGTKTPTDVEKWQSDPTKDGEGRPQDSPACKWKKEASGPHAWTVTGAPSCAKERTFALAPFEAGVAKEGRLKLSVSAEMIGTDSTQAGEAMVTPLFPNGTASGPAQLVRLPLRRESRVTEFRTPEVVVPPGTEFVRVALRGKAADRGDGIRVQEPAVTLREDPIPAVPVKQGTRDLELASWTEPPLDASPRTDNCNWASQPSPKHGSAPAFHVSGAALCTATRTFLLEPADVKATGDGEVFVTVESLVSGFAPTGQEAHVKLSALDESGARLELPGGDVITNNGTALHQTAPRNATVTALRLPAGTKYVRAMYLLVGADNSGGVDMTQPRLHLHRATSAGAGPRDLTPPSWSPAPGSDTNCQWSAPDSDGAVKVTGGDYCARKTTVALRAHQQVKADRGVLSGIVSLLAQGSDPSQKTGIEVTPLNEAGEPLGAPWTAAEQLTAGSTRNISTSKSALPSGTRTLLVRMAVNASKSDPQGVKTWPPQLRLVEKLQGPTLSPPGERDLPLPSWTDRPGLDEKGKQLNEDSCRWSQIPNGWAVRGGRTCSKQQTFTLSPRGAGTVEFEVEAVGTTGAGETAKLILVPLAEDGTTLPPIKELTVPLPADGSTTHISTGPLPIPATAHGVRAVLVAGKPKPGGEIQFTNANLHRLVKPVPEGTLPQGTTELPLVSWKPEPGSGSGCTWTPNGDNEWIVSGGASCGRTRVFGFSPADREHIAAGRMQLAVSGEGKGTGNGERMVLVATPLLADGSIAGGDHIFHRDTMLDHDATWTSVVADPAPLPATAEFLRLTFRVIDSDRGTGTGVRLPRATLVAPVDTPTPTLPPSTPSDPPATTSSPVGPQVTPTPTTPGDEPGGGAARGALLEEGDTRVMRGLISGGCVSLVTAVVVGILTKKNLA